MLGIKIDFISPGKPVENCYIESFNGSVCDELLNMSWLEDFDDARRRAQAWRDDCDVDRPHSSLGDEPPSAFASRFRLLEAENAKRDP
ncbi:MAG: transposase [Planctomycetota bacterium]|nr:transposase [Planctomycetota bacterium]